VIIIGALWKHFQTVRKHRKIVRQECWACGLYKQGLLHDLSKYSPAEFVASAKYFQGDRSPIDAEKEAIGYSKAWLHHKGHNPHHWEYWTDYGANGEIITNKIPANYVIEMICDWIGAGKVYGHGNWQIADLMIYYDKVRSGRHFNPETEQLIFYFFNIIKAGGLNSFHRICREGSAYLTIYESTK